MSIEDPADQARRTQAILSENEHQRADWQIYRAMLGTAAELVLALTMAVDYAHGGIKLEHGMWYALIALGVGIEGYDRVVHRYRYHKGTAESHRKYAGDYA